MTFLHMRTVLFASVLHDASCKSVSVSLSGVVFLNPLLAARPAGGGAF